MLKHPACAAAINSSGFVPGEFSNRVVNEYGVLFKTPLAVETVPLPCLRSPCQTADAVLFIHGDSKSPHRFDQGREFLVDPGLLIQCLRDFTFHRIPKSPAQSIDG